MPDGHENGQQNEDRGREVRRRRSADRLAHFEAENLVEIDLDVLGMLNNFI